MLESNWFTKGMTSLFRPKRGSELPF